VERDKFDSITVYSDKSSLGIFPRCFLVLNFYLPLIDVNANKMDAINNYDDENDDNMLSNAEPKQIFDINPAHNQLISAPLAFSAALVPVSANPFYVKKNVDTNLNLRAEVMYAPALGPQHPMKRQDQNSYGIQNMEFTHIGDNSFKDEQYSFQTYGRANDISSNKMLEGNFQEPARPKTIAVKRDKETDADGKTLKRRRLPDANFMGTETSGPWAMSEPTEEEKAEAILEEVEVEEVEEVPVAEKKKDPTMHINEPEEEDEMWEKVNERKMKYTLPPRPARGSEAIEAKTNDHNTPQFDYQGKPWTDPPSGIRADGGDHACFIPKKCIKKFTGHTKGVQSIEFFPGMYIYMYTYLYTYVYI
jgi:hypothetical protein